MTIRSSMTSLIARLRSELAGDTTLSDQALQDILDARGSTCQALLMPRAPAYTTHASGVGPLEDNAAVYAIPGIIFPGWHDWNLLYADTYASDILIWWLQTAYQSIAPLATPADYTLDPWTGIVTTPTLDRRGLLLIGRSYLFYAACADAWERLAFSLPAGDEVRKLTSGGDTVEFASAQSQALARAAAFRSRGSGGGLAL